MTFISIWLRQLETAGNPLTVFVLGLMVGVGIFEKLSSTVLLGPLLIMLLADSRTRSVGGMGYAFAGVCLGGLPVVGINIYSLVTESRLLGLSSTSQTELTSLEYASNYVALGNGAAERRFVFSTASFLWAEWLEGFAVVSLALVIGFTVWMHGQSNRIATAAGVALFSYVAVGVLLRYLPAETAQNHWIIGTPFHYLAIALASVLVCSMPDSRRSIRSLFFIAIAVLILARGPAVALAFEAIRDDRYRPAWDPSVNRAAAFAASQPEDTVFIAADWGIATQVFCLANGRQDFVFEPFWSYGGRETVSSIVDRLGKQFALVAAPRPRPLIHPNATQQIYDDLAIHDDWVEVSVEPWVRNLRSIEMRAFRRAHAWIKTTE